MIPAIAQYRKGIAKHLRCCEETRKRLLASFDSNMLAPLLDEINQPSMDALHTSFGTPKNVAALLMEQVTPEEAIRYQKRRKLAKTISVSVVAALLAAILIFAIYVFFDKEKPLTYQDDTKVIKTFSYADGDAS